MPRVTNAQTCRVSHGNFLLVPIEIGRECGYYRRFLHQDSFQPAADNRDVGAQIDGIAQPERARLDPDCTTSAGRGHVYCRLDGLFVVAFYVRPVRIVARGDAVALLPIGLNPTIAGRGPRVRNDGPIICHGANNSNSAALLRG